MVVNEPSAQAQQVVISAVNRGGQIAGGDHRYASLAKATVETVGMELARHVQPGETAALCVLAEIACNGRYRDGMVLLLDNHVVLAWFEGMFRVKVHSLAFARTDISDVATTTRDRNLYQDAITFVANGTQQEFVLPSKIAHRRLALMISGALTGALTFNQDSKPLH